MTVKEHLYVGAVASIPATICSSPKSVVLIITSVLIDADHYFFYMIHEKRILLNPNVFMKEHSNWEYFGPRIHLFHNYDTAILSLLAAIHFSGIWWFIGAGIWLHLICDQVATYRKYRFMRIRSLLGDLIRYCKYLKATARGQQNEFMLNWRNTWINHIIKSFPEKSYQDIMSHCQLSDKYTEEPIKHSDDLGSWRHVL
ncbi:MAG: hypothetical protein KKG47_14360 [Proteobacteria bacterium]|nr:hypothetical protein [Pseudomonadota bacterium]MBU1739225.1 hypothetical protein [Pseudomonadota bacterium]